LYREEGLTVRRRKGRKRAVGSRTPAPVPALPNQRWSLDLVHDQMITGRQFRVLNVVDDVTRECLAAVPDTSISDKRFVRELDDLIAVRGKPGMIVSDNGTELTSNAVLEWCGEAKIEWQYTAPGKPTQNAFVESFNAKAAFGIYGTFCGIGGFSGNKRILFQWVIALVRLPPSPPSM
jgi:putative transposase